MVRILLILLLPLSGWSGESDFRTCRDAFRQPYRLINEHAAQVLSRLFNGSYPQIDVRYAFAAGHLYEVRFRIEGKTYHIVVPRDPPRSRLAQWIRNQLIMEPTFIVHAHTVADHIRIQVRAESEGLIPHAKGVRYDDLWIFTHLRFNIIDFQTIDDLYFTYSEFDRNRQETIYQAQNF